MLAGRMKLKYFLVLACSFAAVVVFGLSRACQGGGGGDGEGDAVPAPGTLPPEARATPPPSALPAAAGGDGQGSAAATPTVASDLPARAYDAEVIAWSRRAISGDKMKDATKGKPYKLNLYKDAGSPTVNRAKLDLDRDDKFDEKYTFEPTKITLQRAPADDESYTETYLWNGRGWTTAAP